MMTKSIIFVINRLAIGGAERIVIDEINELLQRGVEVHLVTLRPETKESFAGACNISKEKWHVVSFDGLYDIPAWKSFLQVIKTIQPETIVSHLWFANTITRIATLFTRVPKRIIFEHNVYDSVKSHKQFFIDWALQYTGARIVAVSDTVRQSLISHKIHPSRVMVVQNAIHVKKFNEAEPAAIRKELGIPSDTFLFIAVGRLTSQKAHDTLIQAFKTNIHGHLLIVGDGEEKTHLKDLIISLGLEKQVHLLGIRHDIPELMKASNCFVFPSRYEGVGIVMLEALASGLPVIVTDFPAANGIIENEKNGLVVPIDNVSALSVAMDRMLRSKELQLSCIQEGLQTIKRFSIKQHVDTLLKIIESPVK